MQRDLISVIVPIYNVEKYLDKCIESIVKQSYTNLEIILINDGSTDNCLKKCEEWNKKDERIIVINKENGGLSSARNAGLDVCKGNYIVFVDSDDYINPEMIKELYNSLVKYGSDILICNYYINDEKNIYPNKIKFKNFTISGNDKYKYLYNKYQVMTIIAWNKIYKREIFENLRYPNGKIHEDEYIIFDLLERAKKISYINEPLYYYLQRYGSITNKFNIKRFNVIDALDMRIEKFRENKNYNLILKTKESKYSKLVYLLNRCKDNNFSEKDLLKIKKYKNEFKDLENELCKTKGVSLKCKIKLLLNNPIKIFEIIKFSNKVKEEEKYETY